MKLRVGSSDATSFVAYPIEEDFACDGIELRDTERGEKWEFDDQLTRAQLETVSQEAESTEIVTGEEESTDGAVDEDGVVSKGDLFFCGSCSKEYKYRGSCGILSRDSQKRVICPEPSLVCHE